ncbi:Cna B-type domain-containing protein [Candidatus Saccharibacteria bacterium]|nr:Cna B-type domain-containing protein [Candidatus Saccharibacteria bacterium]
MLRKRWIQVVGAQVGGFLLALMAMVLVAAGSCGLGKAAWAASTRLDDKSYGTFAAEQDIATFTIDKNAFANNITMYYYNSAETDTPPAGIAVANSSERMITYSGTIRYGQVNTIIDDQTIVYMIYKNAAIDSEGNKEYDLVVALSDVKIYPRADVSKETYDDTIAIAARIVNGLPTITAKTITKNKFDYRYGITYNIGVYVSRRGSRVPVADGSFVFTANEINKQAGTNLGTSWENNVQGVAHNRFEETLFGLDNVSLFDESMLKSDGSIVANGANSVEVINDKNVVHPEWSQVAKTAKASGVNFRAQTSGQTGGTNMYLMPDGITHGSTSSSGQNGAIEVWTSGKIDTGTALRQQYGGGVGGDESKALTFDVPDGKEVEYKLIPDEGYIIDEIKVDKGDGEMKSVLPTTAVLGAEGKPIYYTYKFDSGDILDQEIRVTWQKAKEVVVTKKWEGDTEWKDETRPDAISVTLQANGRTYYGQKSDDNGLIAEDGTKYGAGAQVLNDGNSWTYTFKNLPNHDSEGNEIDYAVAESIDAGPYRYQETSNAKISSSSERDEFEITNTLVKAKIEVANLVTGEMGDTGKEFDFTVTMKGAKTGSGFSVVEGVYALKHGEKAETREVPVGMGYEIVELGAEDYTTSNTAGGEKTASGVVVEGDNRIEFTNNRERAVMSGIKSGMVAWGIVVGVMTVGGVLVLKNRGAKEHND